ncbi:hypothetical protein GCM10023194_21900 [Planotetraspora phitsanulokensis]|uniref:Uncharacterized protein n=1 Tax=Planotetraspora phitsanulokensis TaxID=575192 RepID=A0A8J3U737_9ACTN|nr:hypothetical protein [Planotetraspora phitsanulokensis]GII38247.1 hypothetical protein Pph01_32500 [Planotetraspora phitsanulokensis]
MRKFGDGLDEPMAEGRAVSVNVGVLGLLTGLAATRDGADSGFVALRRLLDETASR